jgi:putative ABC transport system permease protein
MLRLAYRNLRARPARTILTALAIAFGVAMILAMRIVTIAVDQADSDVRRTHLAGADLEVSSATGAFLRAELAEEIAVRPEVEIAAPVYRQPEGAVTTQTEQPALLGGHILTGTGLLLLGVDPARLLTPYELAAGSLFSAPDAAEVLLPHEWAWLHGVTVDARITLTTGTQARSYTVVGLLEVSPEETLLGQPTAWLPLATMQAAFETPGAASSILVRLRPGTLPGPARDQLRQDLSTLYIVTSATGRAAGGIESHAR